MVSVQTWNYSGSHAKMGSCLLVIVLCVSSVLGDFADLDRLRRTLFENYTREVIPLNINNTVKLSISSPVIFKSYLQEDRSSLTIETSMKMEWTDVRLSWEPSDFAGIEKIHVSADEVWRPDIVIYNHSPMIELSQLFSKIQLLLYKTGKLLWVPPTTTTLPCVHNALNWPFDNMICYMTIGSWTYNSEILSLSYDKDEGNMLYYTALDEWIIRKFEGYLNISAYPCCPDETYPSVQVKLFVSRNAPVKGIFILFTIAVLIVKFTTVRSLISKDKQSYFLLSACDFMQTSYYLLGSECILLGALYCIIPSSAALPHIVTFLIFMVCVELGTLIFLTATQKTSTA